jgi:2-polyprenyl-3-methyl-5-hydroxy-6-metoxy-1,4-benzoquinol methylase
MSFVRRRFDKTYFDSILYRSHPRSRRNTKRLELVLSHKSGGRLLDIGSGAGDFLRLARSKFDVSAIDTSSYAATSLSPTMRRRLTVGDVENIPLPQPPYDVVTAFNVLEHLHKPVALIRKVSRALTPGGVFVGSVPCNAGLIGTVHTELTKFFDRTHRACYKVSAWHRAFAKAGHLETEFFGEVMLDGGICIYLHTPLWPYLSLNMIFVARKDERTAAA